LSLPGTTQTWRVILLTQFLQRSVQSSTGATADGKVSSDSRAMQIVTWILLPLLASQTSC